MTSQRPCWCPKTKKWRPCWCPKLNLWELNSIFMQILSFVSVNQYGQYGHVNENALYAILVVQDANHVACDVTYVSHEGGNLLLSGTVTYFFTSQQAISRTYQVIRGKHWGSEGCSLRNKVCSSEYSFFNESEKTEDRGGERREEVSTLSPLPPSFCSRPISRASKNRLFSAENFMETFVSPANFLTVQQKEVLTCGWLNLTGDFFQSKQEHYLKFKLWQK